MSLFLHLLSVVLCLGLLSLVFVGWGVLFRRIFGYRAAEIQDVWISGWLGWACVLAMLQIWHLVSPVNSAALILVIAIGCLGAAPSLTELKAILAGKRRLAAVLLLGGAVLAFWLSNHSVSQPAVYDSGLYHLNAVRWNGTHPIVPGLGNLHGRLGYNNASLLYSALLDAGPFSGRSHHIASAWLIFWMLIRCLFAAFELLKRSSDGPRVETMYYAVLLAPLLAWTVNSGYASSHSPDVACFVLAIVVGGELLAMSHFEGRKGNCAQSRFINLVLLSAAGIAVKLSFVVFGLALCGIGLLVLLSGQALTRRTWRPVIIALTLGALVLLPWCVRGVILNGCPAYPAKVLRFDFDWTVPESSSDVMLMRIKTWARAPGAPPETVQHGWAWFRPWAERTFAENVFDIRLPLLTIILAKILFWMRLRRGCTIEMRRCTLLCAPAVLGLAFWFWSAPDPRYQGSVTWVLAAFMLVLSLQHQRAWALPLILGHGAMILAGLVNPIDVIRTYKDASVARQVPMMARETRSGLKLNIPVQGDQCWDAELPCTPYYSPRLALRDPADIRKGFTKMPLTKRESE